VGISEFAPLNDVGRDDVAILSEEDFYYRRCTPDTWNGYFVEGFVFPDVIWGTVRNRGGKLIMSLLSPMFEAVAPVFDYRVVSLPRAACTTRVPRQSVGGQLPVAFGLLPARTERPGAQKRPSRTVPCPVRGSLRSESGLRVAA
jgi:hypothetical protein